MREGRWTHGGGPGWRSPAPSINKRCFIAVENVSGAGRGAANLGG